MTYRELTMMDVKELLRRWAAGHSNRKIARETGTDRGTGWRVSGYDDSGWPSGPGALGFGDPFIVTAIPMGPNATTRYPAAYFRTSFQVPDDPATIASLVLAVNYDDGFVLWLNGVELARRGLTGTVSYGSLSTRYTG